ncbi:glyoxalase/bleomycin resistance/extradiol dioxygenase family protein [Kaistia defluvii]|uniref:VOC family protein n=1 Tax=Kaistia defluvii TaxID=410841 RepID=UPI002253FBC9|nr:glyoxalase/bleomycin resistance/extradiol dioxygenase family protein [Kaistia defluvii]MCX5519030.1 glyoxalase/bleomycin resistance/extradiol dioxygenase family protein [Kaistia defluvii]
MDTRTDETSAFASMPRVLSGVAPYLSVGGAVKASEFYQRALAAEEVMRVPVDEKGRTMHIHLYINGGSVMLADPYEEYGHPLETPQGYTLHLQLGDDIDTWWQRAIDAGMEVVMPLDLQFWGDRYGQLRDPFGVLWSLGARAKAA